MCLKCKIFGVYYNPMDLQNDINEWIESEGKKPSVNSCFKIADTKFSSVGAGEDTGFTVMFLYYEASGRY